MSCQKVLAPLELLPNHPNPQTRHDVAFQTHTPPENLSEATFTPVPCSPPWEQFLFLGRMDERVRGSRPSSPPCYTHSERWLSMRMRTRHCPPESVALILRYITMSWVDYNRLLHQVQLLSVKNRNLKLQKAQADQNWGADIWQQSPRYFSKLPLWACVQYSLRFLFLTDRKKTFCGLLLLHQIHLKVQHVAQMFFTSLRL